MSRFLHFVNFPSSPPEMHPQHHEIEFCLTHKSKLSSTPTPKREFLSVSVSVREKIGSSYNILVSPF